MRRTPFLVAGLLALALAPARVAVAQAVSALDTTPRPRFLYAAFRGRPVPLDVARTPALARRIALDLDGVPLKTALAAIARESGLELSYSDDVLPSGGRVRLQAREITVAAALTDVLLGSGVDVVFRPTGRAALVKRAPAETGAIVGRVTDATTGEAVVGAHVTVDGAGLGALTTEDGQYRIADVPAGTYTVSARRLGYAKLARSVTVAADAEARADFALARTASALDQVVVTGTVVPTEVKALPTPVSVVTSDDIARAGVNHVEQLFRGMIPGVVAPDQGLIDNFPHIYMRGGTDPDPNVIGAGLVKVLVDGVEVADFGAVSQIDPSLIDHVEIVRGPQASTLYGSGAISGVIQVFTKKGTAGRPQTTLRAAAGAQESDYRPHAVPHQEYAGSVSGGATDFTYRLGASYLSNGEWLPYYRSDRTGASAGVHRVEGPVTVDLTALYSDHAFHYQGFGPVVAGYIARGEWTIGSPTVDRSVVLNDNRVQRGVQQTYGANIRYDATPWWEHRVTVGYDRLLSRIDQDRPQGTSPADTTVIFYRSPTRKTSYGYNTTARAQLSPSMSGSLTLGLDHWEYATSSQYTYLYQGTPVPGTARVTPDRRYANSGYFAQAQVDVAEALFLTAGARIEENDNFGNAYKHATSPRFGIAYAHDVGGVTLKGRASYGKAIRAPGPTQKEGSAPTPTYVRLGNPDLEPEAQQGYDAGLEVYVGSRISVQATYYHQMVDRLIALRRLSEVGDSQAVEQFQNIGRVRNTGLELQVMARLTPAVMVNGTYSIAHSTVRTLSAALAGDAVYQYHVGDQLHAVPERSGGLTVTYATPRLSASLGATYIAAMQNYDFIAYYASRYGGVPPRPTGRDYLMTYPTIVKMNANLSYAFTPHISGLLRIDNLTNSQTIESSNIIPVYGRSTVAGVQITM